MQSLLVKMNVFIFYYQKYQNERVVIKLKDCT